jgi:hypothetical protein
MVRTECWFVVVESSIKANLATRPLPPRAANMRHEDAVGNHEQHMIPTDSGFPPRRKALRRAVPGLMSGAVLHDDTRWPNRCLAETRQLLSHDSATSRHCHPNARSLG